MANNPNEKKMGGVWGEVCVVWASVCGGRGGKWIYLTKNPFSLGEGIFYKLTKNPNLTKKLFFFGGGGGGGGGVIKG